MREVNLKDLVISLETGKRPKGGAISTGIPSLGGEHINVDGGFNLNEDKLKYVELEYFNNMTKGKLKEKDILIVKDGATTGKVAYVDESFPLKQACINEHVFLIRVSEAVLPKYLFYYFYSPVGQRSILKDFRGATVGGISTGFIDMNIYLPSKDIQKRIVNLLDVAKQIIDKRKEQIQACDELIKSQFIEMFGDPINNPMGWEVKKLKDLCEAIVDCPHSTPKHSQEKTDYPSIRTTELKNGYIDWSSMKYVDEDEYQARTKRIVPQYNDIVYGREGTYGEAVLIPEGYKFCLGQRVVLLRANTTKCYAQFLWYSVRSDYVYYQAKAKNIGATVGHVNVGDIKEFWIMLPPINEQRKFIQFLESVGRTKDRMKQSLIELENNFSALMQRAFQGELF